MYPRHVVLTRPFRKVAFVPYGIVFALGRDAGIRTRPPDWVLNRPFIGTRRWATLAALRPDTGVFLPLGYSGLGSCLVCAINTIIRLHLKIRAAATPDDSELVVRLRRPPGSCGGNPVGGPHPDSAS